MITKIVFTTSTIQAGKEVINEELQCHLIVSLQYIIQNHPKISPIAPVTFVDCLIDILDSCHDKGQPGLVKEDVLLTISALTATLDVDVMEQRMRSLLPHLKSGMKNNSDVSICQLSVALTGDIFRALETRTIPYYQDVMDTLFDLLSQEPVLPVRAEIIAVFGDVIVAVEEHCKPDLEAVLFHLEESSQMCNEVRKVYNGTRGCITP